MPSFQYLKSMLYTSILTPLLFVRQALAEEGWEPSSEPGDGMCAEGQVCPPEGGAMIALIAIPLVVTLVSMALLSKHFGTKAVEQGVVNVQSHARAGLGLGFFLGALTYVGTLVALSGGIPGSQLMLVIALVVVGAIFFGATWAGRK